MANLREILGESYREDMSLADIEKALANMKLADLSSGEYVSKGKLTDYETRMKKAEKALADKLSEEEKAQLEMAKREEYYKQLEKTNAKHEYVSKLSKSIKDEKILDEIADLFANGEYAIAIDKQNEYFANYHKNLEKTIKDELMKQNPQATAQNGSSPKKTKDEIMAIKDASARQKLIQENIDLFK